MELDDDNQEQVSDVYIYTVVFNLTSNFIHYRKPSLLQGENNDELIQRVEHRILLLRSSSLPKRSVLFPVLLSASPYMPADHVADVLGSGSPGRVEAVANHQVQISTVAPTVVICVAKHRRRNH